jgi:hypothetical protein
MVSRALRDADAALSCFAFASKQQPLSRFPGTGSVFSRLDDSTTNKPALLRKVSIKTPFPYNGGANRRA